MVEPVDPLLKYLLFGTFIMGVIGIWLWLKYRRIESLKKVAWQLGYRCSFHKDRFAFQDFRFHTMHRRGAFDHYSTNLFEGAYLGRSIRAFDYICKTRSADEEQAVKKFHNVIFVIELDFMAPELVIRSGGVGRTFLERFGFNGIRFEHPEFSERYEVISKNEKFASDFCGPDMIKLLLENEGPLLLEVERNFLALSYQGPLDGEDYLEAFALLKAIRDRIPGYLTKRQHGIRRTAVIA